jgi:hypothetical protein
VAASHAAGEEVQVDFGYLGVWFDPRAGRRRRVWAFSMVLRYSRHLFIRPVIRMDQRGLGGVAHAGVRVLRRLPGPDSERQPEGRSRQAGSV